MSLENSLGNHPYLFDKDKQEYGIFAKNYDSSGNENQEVNLSSYSRLKTVQTADEIRKVLLEMAEEEGHPGDLRIPMPDYDEGIVAYKKALLDKLEDYLLRQVFIKIQKEGQNPEYTDVSIDEGVVTHKDELLNRLNEYVSAGSMK